MKSIVCRIIINYNNLLVGIGILQQGLYGLSNSNALVMSRDQNGNLNLCKFQYFGMAMVVFFLIGGVWIVRQVFQRSLRDQQEQMK
ncbi:MAG: hypothetical protein WCE93_11875 [Nitrososphaeraceae archaeon]